MARGPMRRPRRRCAGVAGRSVTRMLIGRESQRAALRVRRSRVSAYNVGGNVNVFRLRLCHQPVSRQRRAATPF